MPGPNPRLLDAEPSFHDSPDGLIIRKQQVITDHLLSSTASIRFEGAQRREGEFMHIAAIPTLVVEKWQREGFDIMTDRNITARQIAARLKAEGLDAFLATSKRV